MKRSKDGLFLFPPKKTPIMEKSLFDWPIVLQYDVKAKYRLVSRKFFGHKVFSAERSHVCIRSTNQSNRSISVRLLFLFCSRVFVLRSYENRSKALKCYNKSNSKGSELKGDLCLGGLWTLSDFFFCLQVQSNSVNTDTEGAIESVRIKRVECRKSVRDSANSPWWWGVRIKRGLTEDYACNRGGGGWGLRSVHYVSDSSCANTKTKILPNFLLGS